MHVFPRPVLLPWLALGLLMLAASAVSAQTNWPSALNYSVGLSTDETARGQVSAFLSGPINESFGAKIGGSWITAGSDNRAFVADAYLDYREGPLYLAAGRKFVPFGPAGVLVSPGISGGEAQLNYDRVSIQAIAGTLAFTPVTGGTRFTFAGNRSPADEDITAGRIAFRLTESGAPAPVTVGVNALDLLDETGWSGDISIDANRWLNLFGESAEFDDISANVYGVRLSNQKSREDPSRYTMVVFYHRRIPVGFVPAQVGATQYFEDQTGWVAGLYHQFGPEYGLGLYADDEDAIISLFGYVPLR